LLSVERAKAVVSSTGQVTGRLTVSAPLTVGSLLVLPRLPQLFERYPGLHIELRLEDRIVDLVADAVDVAIRGGLCGPDNHEVVAHALLRYRRWLVASPAYLARKGQPNTLQSLARHTCLIQHCSKPGSPKWSLRHQSGGELQTVNIDGPLSCSTPIALLELARAGVGVALVGQPFVTQAIRDGTLCRVLPDWETDEIPTWAIHRRELKGSPSVRALLEALRTVTPNTPLR
jgi:DNA-binding transcriptional LysR family regulator